MAVDMQIENKICDQFECGADGNCEFKIFLSNDKPEFVIIETPTSCPEISFVNNGVAGRYSIIEVAVAGTECNTVIELKWAHRAA